MSEFDRWQGRFAVSEYIFGEAPNVFLASQKHRLPKSGKALAVADGEGRNGVFLAESGLDTLSMDFSPNGQAKAQALATKRGVTLKTELADVHAYNWPAEEYDVIAEIFTQFSTPDERAGKFAGIRKALKKGGLLLLEGYTPKQLEFNTGGPKQIEHLYTMELLEKEFGDFSKVLIKQYETMMTEGGAHAGMAAVIDLVAVK
jgi:cyclopropane fatty-acyl-phospholipid synthase-like methyltransferase